MDKKAKTASYYEDSRAVSKFKFEINLKKACHQQFDQATLDEIQQGKYRSFHSVEDVVNKLIDFSHSDQIKVWDMLHQLGSAVTMHYIIHRKLDD